MKIKYLYSSHRDYLKGQQHHRNEQHFLKDFFKEFQSFGQFNQRDQKNSDMCQWRMHWTETIGSKKCIAVYIYFNAKWKILLDNDITKIWHITWYTSVNLIKLKYLYTFIILQLLAYSFNFGAKHQSAIEVGKEKK